MILGITFTPAATAAPPDGIPDPRGQAAIDRLGDSLPQVAMDYGLTLPVLRARFLSDPSLSVDIDDLLFYVNPTYESAPGSAPNSQPDAGEAPPTTDPVFTLHSRPGADHVIYLDFDGHTTTGTPWNSSYGITTIVSPAYNIDNAPSLWSNTELSRIQDTWRIVTEDFAPFDIDVTTEEPRAGRLIRSDAGDPQWGIRVVITDDTFANCGCGGHAYINSFNWNTDTPAFVYNSSLLGMAESSSHEVGHAVGLSHDGTSTATYYTGHGAGEASWAPIMGVGYYKDVTQWSRGEYYDSNNTGPGANYNGGLDDLQILTTRFGFGYRIDDHGNTSAAASALLGPLVSESGVIERTADIDVFQFSTGAGPVSLAINPDPTRPNLNIKATLRDSGGNQVAVSNSTLTLSASFSLSLTTGTYYLEVEGVGTGNPASLPPTGYTEYATLGQYTVTGTLSETVLNVTPAASFTHRITGLTVDFTDTSIDSDGSIEAWSWDLGDGNTSTAQNPSHAYTAAGTRTVMLTVSDDGGATASATVAITSVDLPPPTVDDPAISEITRSGSVSYGNIESTYSSDNVAQVLTEELYGRGKRSRLNHQWTFNVTGGDSVVFFVEAWHDSYAEDFRLEYSTGGRRWIPMLTITNGKDDYSMLGFELPASTTGTLHVRALDTDRFRSEATTDSLSVDTMFVRSASGPELP